MGCDRLSRFSGAASLARLAFTAVTVLAACAQSVEDSGDPPFDDGGATATADAGAHPISTRDGSTSTPDTSTGGGADASTRALDGATAADTGGSTGPVDSGGGGPVSGNCPSSPIYTLEGLAEATAANPRLCSSGCGAAECCYAGVFCVDL